MWNWISGATTGSKGEADVKTTEKQGSPDSVNEAIEGTDQPSSISQETADGNTKNLSETAATVSNFLFNVASAATKTATKLKESVDTKLDKTIIGDFQRENDKFVQERKSKMKEEPVPPWVGYLEEEEMKSQILSLSTDDRNFLRDPPSGVDFHFDMDTIMPVAIATLQADKNLSEMRFKLVPKKLSEERFWRNYFYRVSLIKQKSQLNRLAESETKRHSIPPTSDQKDSQPDVSKPTKRDKSPAQDIVLVDVPSSLEETIPDSPTSHEFISDSYQQEQQTGLSVEEMSQLNMKDQDKKTSSSEWETELQNELQEFEFVSEDTGNMDDEPDPNWEKEIEDMLGLEKDM